MVLGSMGVYLSFVALVAGRYIKNFKGVFKALFFFCSSEIIYFSFFLKKNTIFRRSCLSDFLFTIWQGHPCDASHGMQTSV